MFSVLFLDAAAFAETYNVDSQSVLYATAQSLAAPAGYPLVNGEVRKVDLSAQKITIRHEEIPNLDMPPMTMVFKVVSVELLDKVAAGSKIRFAADSINEQMTVLWLEVL
ncbi:MAG: copper-binding protein [Deltaproteobacteria bacterium]|nr:copper-binding protein [Deltaproteobacteria bacterium]